MFYKIILSVVPISCIVSKYSLPYMFFSGKPLDLINSITIVSLVCAGTPTKCYFNFPNMRPHTLYGVNRY